MKADLAVVDAAYSREDRGSEMREEVMKTVEEMVKDNHPLLLPVPHYGRGFRLLSSSTRGWVMRIRSTCLQSFTMNG